MAACNSLVRNGSLRSRCRMVIGHFWAISSTASLDCKARSRKESTRAISRHYYISASPKGTGNQFNYVGE